MHLSLADNVGDWAQGFQVVKQLTMVHPALRGVPCRWCSVAAYSSDKDRRLGLSLCHDRLRLEIEADLKISL